MLVFAREVFVCKCPTHVPRDEAEAAKAPEMARRLVFGAGTAADVDRLDREYHSGEHLAELRSRLDRGEHWLFGEVDRRIVTYTWLRGSGHAAYPSLPGCEIVLRDDVGYGYDAWTSPALRGRGLRRRAFVEELELLAAWGLAWEASFFVKHQLDGATRSLGSVGIDVIPLWRVWLQRDRSLGAEKLHEDADAARPAWDISR